jgi:hypothetical protein
LALAQHDRNAATTGGLLQCTVTIAAFLEIEFSRLKLLYRKQLGLAASNL